MPPSRRSSSAWTAACTVVVDTELVDTKVVAGMEDADEEGVRVTAAEEVDVDMDVPEVPGGTEDTVYAGYSQRYSGVLSDGYIGVLGSDSTAWIENQESTSLTRQTRPI